jgi:isopentenyl diphosphate isomerase/L-lactate dehydrogenase-like FMN-dependent dehydrogenase
VNIREAYNIDDLRRIAERRLPRVAYDYLERGAEDDVTLVANREALTNLRFRPRVLADVSGRSLEVELFGKRYAAPVGVAPTGAAGLYCFEADVALARAAEKANVPFVLSTASFVAMERVAAEAGGTKWFQLYASKDREANAKLIRRALDAGYEGLVVTTDVPVGANREYNKRNGFEIPFRLNARNIIDGMLHPRWLAGVFFRTLLDSGVPRFQNVDADVGGRVIAKNLSEFRARRDALDWSDIAWMREIWPKQLMVKGILSEADALLALKHGADGVFVSNHGGRQLDGAISPIDVLPQVAAAVGGKLKIMADSGFRRGTDIVRALALGADMVFVGRAPLYGAAAGGEPGITRALDLLKSEIDRVMALTGCRNVAAITAEVLSRPPFVERGGT